MGSPEEHFKQIFEESLKILTQKLQYQRFWRWSYKTVQYIGFEIEELWIEDNKIEDSEMEDLKSKAWKPKISKPKDSKT